MKPSDEKPLFNTRKPITAKSMAKLRKALELARDEYVEAVKAHAFAKLRIGATANNYRMASQRLEKAENHHRQRLRRCARTPRRRDKGMTSDEIRKHIELGIEKLDPLEFFTAEIAYQLAVANEATGTANKPDGSQAAPPEAEIVDDSGEVLGILLGGAPADLSWYETTKAQFSPKEQARIEGLWEGRMQVVRALKDCVAWAHRHHEFQPEGPGIHDRPCLLCGEPNLHDIHFIKAEAKR